MRIGIPKEIKTNEHRVAIVPSGVAALVAAGHAVIVETGAGLGSGFSDADYIVGGATISADAGHVWATAELIVKVKEPVASEWHHIRSGQVIFTYFHFAASEELTRALLHSGAICIAYETVSLSDRELPLLTPMSEVAGRMAVQEGAKYLERQYGGLGVLLGGVPGVAPARVLILGGGTVGLNAAKMAAGLGAQVIILDVSLERLRYLSDVMPANVQLILSNHHNLTQQLSQADLVIGAVLIPGGQTPKLVKREDLGLMRTGAVLVDVAIDQGGCFETSHATTHSDPTYIIDGIVHYAVANMPGGVPMTATLALTNATFPYVQTLADMGYQQALRSNHALRQGLNIWHGIVTHQKVAEAFGLAYHPAETCIA